MSANRWEAPGDPSDALLQLMDRDDADFRMHQKIWLAWPRRLEWIDDEMIDINAKTRVDLFAKAAKSRKFDW